jgi:hypothetical protein
MCTVSTATLRITTAFWLRWAPVVLVFFYLLQPQKQAVGTSMFTSTPYASVWTTKIKTWIVCFISVLADVTYNTEKRKIINTIWPQCHNELEMGMWKYAEFINWSRDPDSFSLSTRGNGNWLWEQMKGLHALGLDHHALSFFLDGLEEYRPKIEFTKAWEYHLHGK